MILFHFIESYVKCDRILKESVVLDRRKFVSLHLQRPFGLGKTWSNYESLPCR